MIGKSPFYSKQLTASTLSASESSDSLESSDNRRFLPELSARTPLKTIPGVVSVGSPGESKVAQLTALPEKKLNLSQRVCNRMIAIARGKELLSSDDLRARPGHYGPLARFELGLIKNPHETIRGMNVGFSYFHQICDQIQDIFHTRWDKVSAMGTSNCSNICDFGKQSVATAKYARQQILNHVNHAAGRGHSYPPTACEQHIQQRFQANDLELYLLAYPPRTARSFGETALLVKVGNQRIVLAFRPADGQKIKPKTGTRTIVEGVWSEANDLLMKNNVRQLKLAVDGEHVADLLHYIRSSSVQDTPRTPELNRLLEQLSCAPQRKNSTAHPAQENKITTHLEDILEDRPSTPDTSIRPDLSVSDESSSTANFRPFNVRTFHSTDAIIDALVECGITLPANLTTTDKTRAALTPANIWKTLSEACPTMTGMPQLQSPVRADLARFGWRMMSMQMASEMAGMASDMLDAMMQFRKSLEEFKGHQNDPTHPLDIFHPLPIPDSIVSALKAAPLPSALTNAIKTLPTPQKMKTLADSFERLDQQLTTVALDGLNKVTGQQGFVRPGERILPRPQDIATNKPATVKVKLITHPPRTLTSNGQTALAFEVNGEMVHAVGYRPALGKARRWTGILAKEKLSLAHMRPLLRKQNLKTMDLELTDTQIRALLTELNQQRADLTGNSEPFLPQVGHIKIEPLVAARQTQAAYGRNRSSTTANPHIGNDVDHIRHALEQANTRLEAEDYSLPITIPHEIDTPGTTSRTLAATLRAHQAPLHNMHYPEHLTLSQKMKFIGNFKRSFQQFEILATQVLGEMEKCLQLTESLMKDLPETLETQIRALSSTPFTPKYPSDSKPLHEQTWKEYAKSFLPYGMNVAKGFLGLHEEGQTSIPSALYESARAVAKTPAAWEHLRRDLNGLTDTIDSIKEISDRLWRPLVENVPESRRMENINSARERIDELRMII